MVFRGVRKSFHESFALKVTYKLPGLAPQNGCRESLAQQNFSCLRYTQQVP